MNKRRRKIKGKICNNSNIKLYHLSEENYNNKIFKPRIPSSAAENENKTIARVCFSSSMSGAYRAIEFYEKGGWSYPLYVHMPENINSAIQNKNVIIPHEDLVFDVHYTNEYWIREKVKLKCIGKAIFKYTRNSYMDDMFRTKIAIKWIEKYD